MRTSPLTRELLTRTTQNATFSDLPPSDKLFSSDLPIQAPSGLTVFYEWVAVSNNGLQGMPGRYGLCPDSSAGCNVVFVSPMVTTQAQRFTLRQLDGRYDETINLPGGAFFEAPTVVIAGLRAGRYKWQFSIPSSTAGSTLVQKSGEFVLLEAPRAP